jgi:hypothetical protein
MVHLCPNGELAVLIRQSPPRKENLMRQKLSPAFPIIALSAALSACDTLAEPDYAGEALLSLTGSVEMDNARTEGKLRAALAFENEFGDRLDIMDVETSGEFPSKFTLDVYTPPPVGALFQFEEGEPKIGVGYITAVPEAHAETIRFASLMSVGGCAVEPGTADEEQSCPQERQWCTSSDDECYSESIQCDPDDLELEHCKVLSSEGDPTLKEDPWTKFAGFSKNFIVLYLEEDADVDTLTSVIFGDGAGLSAGYHLIETRPNTPAEDQASKDCFAAADAQALARYNSEFEATYTSIDELWNLEPCSVDAVECPPPDPNAEAIDGFTFEAQQELRCQQTSKRLIPVPSPEAHPITVRVDANVQATYWAD